MTDSPVFNYIITIHNKEDLIEQVMMCVLLCCRENSHIYPVLDGCTDGTEEIIDKIINTFANVPITKIFTTDVHEILSINAGLRAANQQDDGYNIVLQDDVLLADYSLEKKVSELYQWVGPKLGYVSFRMGVNFKQDALTSNNPVPYNNFIENTYGHGIKNAEPLLPGYLAYRTVPIKSPVCIPTKIIRSVGLLDERLAPCIHDEPDYAIRLIKAGYQNAVFHIRFHSDINWGGTRTNQNQHLSHLSRRNMNRIREWHADDLARICSNEQSTEVVKFPHIVNEEENRLALEIWKENRRKLDEYQLSQPVSITTRFKSVIKKLLSK